MQTGSPPPEKPTDIDTDELILLMNALELSLTRYLFSNFTNLFNLVDYGNAKKALSLLHLLVFQIHVVGIEEVAYDVCSFSKFIN